MCNSERAGAHTSRLRIRSHLGAASHDPPRPPRCADALVEHRAGAPDRRHRWRRWPGVTAHFSRFRVTEISLDAQALGQFDDSNILAAADLLADARVDVIGWSGTSSGWLGFDADRRLCERIRERTGIPATTAVLALNELLALRGHPAARAGDALHRGRAATHRRQLPQPGRRRGRGAPSGHPREPRVRRGRARQTLLALMREVAAGPASGHHHVLHQPARRTAGSSKWSANWAFRCWTP